MKVKARIQVEVRKRKLTTTILWKPTKSKKPTTDPTEKEKKKIKTRKVQREGRASNHAKRRMISTIDPQTGTGGTTSGTCPQWAEE